MYLKAFKLLALLILNFSIINTSFAFRLVHFNIKELTTAKLLDDGDEQVLSALNTLKTLDGDLLSINEMQYDLPDIPKFGLPGSGSNVERLLTLLNENLEQWSWNFAQSNTGNNARAFPNGEYPTDTESKEAREMADKVNFGLFPGQYSTAFATKYEVQKKIVFTDIKWVDWNPDFDPSEYNLPQDVSLFDKSFIHTVVNIDGKLVNMITFHTVPAYGFGDEHSPNLLRNAEQLSFLDWYLLGECNVGDLSVVRQCGKYNDVKPFDDDDLFIAVGDFNVDIRGDKPGSFALRRIVNSKRIKKWVPVIKDEMFINRFTTHITEGVDLKKYKMDRYYGQSQLDYFIISEGFEIVGGEVYSPESKFEEHDCYFNYSLAEKMAMDLIKKYKNEGIDRSVEVSNRGYGDWCVISTSSKFSEFRKGSDHFPIYVDLRISQ